MTAKPKLKEVPILNPCYAGAAPEMVGLALSRHKPTGEKADDGEKSSPIIGNPPYPPSV